VGDASVGRRAASRARPNDIRMAGRRSFPYPARRLEPVEFEIPPEFVVNSPFPLVTVTGLDEGTGGLCMLYADARGACRVSQMSLTGGVWKTGGTSRGSSSASPGTVSSDGATVTELGRPPATARTGPRLRHDVHEDSLSTRPGGPGGTHVLVSRF
jgi:hypothetical protein